MHHLLTGTRGWSFHTPCDSLSPCIYSPQTHLGLQSADMFLFLQLANVDAASNPSLFPVSRLKLWVSDTQVSPWVSDTHSYSCLLLLCFEPIRRQLLPPPYCSGTGQPITVALVWHGRCDRRDEGIQHCPWPSEGFLCPFAGRHDHNIFQLTSIELHCLSRSGASLKYYIKAFARKLPKSLMPQAKSSFILSTDKCNLCLALSLHPKYLRDQVHHFLVSSVSAFWQLCLDWCMFLPFPSVWGQVSSFPLKTSMVQSPFILAHIRNYFVTVTAEES